MMSPEVINPAFVYTYQQEAAAMARERSNILQVLLEALTPQQRFIVACRLADQTLTQIAASLGRSTSTVHKLEQRALRRLRKLLAHGGVTSIRHI